MAKFDKVTDKARTLARRDARDGQTPRNMLRATSWALRDAVGPELGLSTMTKRQGMLSAAYAAHN